MKTILVTGGFDPLHSGHIQYIKEAKKLGGFLVVGLNSDEWLTRKKGRPFMPLQERVEVLKALKAVDKVITFDDSDNTACDAIAKTLDLYGSVCFANGGDRTDGSNTPEYNEFSDNGNVSFRWGVGGSYKKNSSSWILDEWKTQKTKRTWGHWRVLDDKGTVKVKELIIEPGKSLSNQIHEFRSEHWYILQGTVGLRIETETFSNYVQLKENNSYVINQGVWHKATNCGNDNAHILEVQYGSKCVEEDIRRKL